MIGEMRSPTVIKWQQKSIDLTHRIAAGFDKMSQKCSPDSILQALLTSKPFDVRGMSRNSLETTVTVAKTRVSADTKFPIPPMHEK